MDLLGLHRPDLVEPPDMAVFSTELRVDECCNQILGEGLPDHARTKTKNVDVVMFHHLVSRI